MSDGIHGADLGVIPLDATRHVTGDAIGGNDHEFPRFLNRERSSDPSLPQPPPLPHRAWGKPAIIANNVNLRVVIGACASFGAVAAVTSVLFTNAQYHHVQNYNDQYQTALLVPPPVEQRDDVKDVVAPAVEHAIEPVIENLPVDEARLGYASNLVVQLDALARDAMSPDRLALEQLAATAATETASARPAPEQHDDAVALMILGNHPGIATVSAGDAGGASAMAAGEPGPVVMTTVPGLQEAVVAGVEMISQSGQSSSAGEMPIAGSDDRAMAEAAVPPVVVAPEPAANAGDAAPAAATLPVKRQHRQYASKADNSAAADGRAQRRAKRADDALKIKPPHPPTDSQVPASVAGASTTDEKPAGPLTKFFAWLKSGREKIDRCRATLSVWV